MTVSLKTEITNNIKLLIFKENPKILEKINYHDVNVFLEPLLFSYFNNSDNLNIEEILQGYFIKKKPLKIEHSYNKNGIAYIPKIGYFKKEQKKLYDTILKIGDFEILKYVHPTQEKYFVETYKGHTTNHNPAYNSVWEAHYQELHKAILIIKE